MASDTVIYPAIFTRDGDYILVQIPDLEGGYTQGNDLLDAVKMAQDLIGNLLMDEIHYPTPTDPMNWELNTDEKVVYINTDLNLFRLKYAKRVRKNVTIPAYLNKLAKQQKVNVSQVLTEALSEKFGL
ncbi:type II toxin-antitoxin system HicB family antitoxin [Levilactobacillus bambusae]|uniref:Antitoxin HicB n=1 Tax=Levilactobacillus bambusae TaxID=2024736 RepID=A0A2V1N027_9LACO|nr:type II toxin-antitoxin system HicB family antitoxin [Levilactobacillus bambusae]PWG00422.1 antitoxin HicB [Levilactobacillus bambusae]